MQLPLSPTLSTTSSLKELEVPEFSILDEENQNKKEVENIRQLHFTKEAAKQDEVKYEEFSKLKSQPVNSEDLVRINSNLQDNSPDINLQSEQSLSQSPKAEYNTNIPSPIDTTSIQSSVHKTPLFREQLKYCMQIMKTLKRHRDSFPFNQPVDPVTLQIPDYFDVIKRPMDLGTISNKLAAGIYSSLNEWISDIRLVFSNCYAYNRPDNPVYSMGKNLEKSFDTMMKKMPTGAGGPPPDQYHNINQPNSSGPTSQSPGGTRRSSITSVGSLSDSSRRRTTTTASTSDVEDLKYATTLIRDFWSKKISPVSWPFLQPVDPVALGIPDYLTVVKSPMDLGTVKKKLESKSYVTGSEFDADVRLVFSNCYLYNVPDSEVVKLCRAVEKIFNDRWANRPSLQTSTASMLSSIDTINIYDGLDEGDLDEDTASLIQMKSAQIQQLQEEIKELMTHSRFKSKRPGVGSGKKRSSGTVSSSIGTTSTTSMPKKQKSSPAISNLKPLTFEEKRQLSLDINDLPPERLGKVLEIINESMPNIRNEAENGEIELDVDTLSLTTLHALIKYVKQCKIATKNESSSHHSKNHKYAHHSGRYSEDDEDNDHGTDSD